MKRSSSSTSPCGGGAKRRGKKKLSKMKKSNNNLGLQGLSEVTALKVIGQSMRTGIGAMTTAVL